MKKLLAVLLACIMVVGICTTAMAAEGEEAGEKQVLKIAIATCFTGDGARGANTQLYGLQVALNEIEESGYCKDYTFDLQTYDDKYDTTEAVTVANKLVSDGCKVVFGHLNATVTLAGLGVYEEEHIPCFTPSGSSDAVVDSGFQYVYLCVPQDRLLAPTLVKHVVEKEGKQNIGMLYCNNDQGQAGLKFVENACADFGIELAAKESYVVGDSDYTGQLTSMKAANVDCVVIWGGEVTQRATMITQIRQYLGTDCVICGDANFSNASFIEATAPADRAGVIYPVAWSSTSTDEKSLKYIDEFVEIDDKHTVPGAVTVRFYDGMYLLATALNNMGPYDVNADDFTEKLNEAIKASTYDGLQGTLAPQENGECLSNFTIVTFNEEGNEAVVE